ncbi:pitrilysin family protein [Thermodesulfovibrio sp. 3907-1M]|uniref:Pitrilysin family protein n=1 Tax=Thermodesulfovibrio autotrophicus TaxID=3118333 RepID=A0AAU8GUC9_9BACT
MKGYRSFVLGVWIKHGSRHEPSSKNGLSHFIEHLFFQGTPKRDAHRISLEIDTLGGDINAFTSREFTSIYIKVLDTYMLQAIELIGDIYSNPLFPEQEIEKERSVILDEIRTINDTPDELVHDLFMENSFPDGLGQPIIGREEAVLTITRKDIVDRYNEFYGNSIISCAGSFDEEKLIESLEKNIKPRIPKKVVINSNALFSPSLKLHEKDLNEIHLCMGTETFPFNSSHRYALILLNCIIGGSVSSRLFQEIREKRGWVYNIYSFTSFYHDTGLFGVYTACEPKKINKIVESIFKILKKIPENLKKEEFERAKTQTISQIIFSQESPSSVMHNLAYQELYLGQCYTLQQQIRQIEAVSFNEVKDMASILKEKDFSITLLGPVTEKLVF